MEISSLVIKPEHTGYHKDDQQKLWLYKAKSQRKSTTKGIPFSFSIGMNTQTDTKIREKALKYVFNFLWFISFYFSLSFWDLEPLVFCVDEGKIKHWNTNM